MTYRDENDALRAKLAEAEAENTRLKALLEPRPRGGVKHGTLAGGPTSVEEVIVLEGELSRDDHDVLLESLLGMGLTGQPTTLGRSLVVSLVSQESARIVQVTITPKDGKTTVRVRESFAGLLGGLYGGLFGGLGGGGLGLVLPLTLLSDPGNGVLAVSAAAAWLAAVFAGTRIAYGRSSTRRAADAQRLAHRLAEAAREAIAKRRERPRVRVEAPEGDEDEAASERDEASRRAGR